MLPALMRRIRGLSVGAITWVERAQALLSNRALIVLAAHYYQRDVGSELDGDSIRENLGYLSEACSLLPLREALGRLENGKALPRKAVSLVVDDAALPFYHSGWPLLRDFGGIPFSLAVIPGMIRADSADHLISRVMYGVTSERRRAPEGPLLERAASRLGLGDGASERSRLRTLFAALRKRDRHALGELVDHLDVPDEEYMTWDQLDELQGSGAVDLVSHSMSHPRFRYVTGEWLDWELARSKEILEKRGGRSVETFVFPYGSPKGVTDAVRQSLRKNGYRFALLTEPGIVTRTSDRFRLPRVDAEVIPEQFRRSVNASRRPFSERPRISRGRDPISAPVGSSDG
jgi:peptidoglycan/xylan/chitin deacetylase (PgdA/CDA1 family)